jgi:hypothetical protein
VGDHAVLSGPVARGELGQVWSLATDRGRWAVKEPFDPPAPQDAAADATYQEAVRAGGVSLPDLVRTVDGHVVGHVGSAHVRLYEWVELQPLERRLDPVSVGETVAAIHRVHHHGASGLHWWYTEPVGADRWDALISELEAAGAPFAAMLAAHRDELVALEAWLEPPDDVQTCHRDLFADNVLRTHDDGLCVIDWENSGLADPSQELAVVLLEFAVGDQGRATCLYEAYVGTGGPGRLERPGQFAMAIAQLGHLGELACRRWLDPTQDRARVAEFTNEPLTRQHIYELLDAVPR